MLTVEIYPERMIAFTSQVFAGLYDLRNNNELHIRRAYRGFPSLNPDSVHFQLVSMRVEDEVGRRVNVVIDLIDGAQIPSARHLEWADVYFKASLRPGITADDSPKVVPFGLRYACTSGNESLLDRFLFALISGLRGHRTRFADSSRLYRMVSNPIWLALSRLKATEAYVRLPPKISHFESPPSKEVKTLVYYRTRVYPLDDAKTPEIAEEFHKVNEVRANTIRALRNSLGPSFVGGLRPTPFALASYADITMQEPWGLHRHLEMVKQSAICVTTHGLFDCIDWKVAEYLAASKCLVVEKLLSELPVPLEEGGQILSFTNPEECVRQCELLLQSPDLMAQSRQEAFDYYQQHVAPASIMRNCLTTALGHS